jgi:hypothetical protein
MNQVRQLFRHPAGKIGLTLGLTIGFVAAVMGEASTALFFAGFCQFLASRMKRK